MKLKCRIHEKDYDIVQGATFTDNFNETLDSGVIVLDQVYKIKDLQPFDDVFIWNADEEFEGYGNIGDIVAIDNNIEVSGQLIGSGVFGEPIELGEDGISVDEQGTVARLSGAIIQIWSYRFYDFTNQNEDTCRYDIPEMSLTLNIYDENTDTTTSVSGFYIKEESNNTHGNLDSNIILTNGTYSFSCVFDTTNRSFVISKVQSGLEIRSITVVSSSYKLQDIDKYFTVNIYPKVFSDSGITTFQIKVLFRGIEYVFTKISIDLTTGDSRTVYFYNEKFGTVGFLFGYDLTLGTTTIKNSVPVIGDIEHIFTEVDSIQIIELTGTNGDYKPLPKFFKHLLVDDYTEDMIGLETGLYKYVINLFSETKKLEKIVLPNVSITQSLLEEEKRTCWFYLNKYIDTYSPKYKKVSNSTNKYWSYVQKYSLSETGVDSNGLVANLKEIFDKTICPEMSLTNPSLKDVLSQIMIVKDMIPVVKNDVIYGLDIGNIVGKFDRSGNSSFNATNFTQGSISSAEFSTDARREHSNALSQENSAHMVEYLGFRTPNSAFLTLDGLTLETRFPIYKINSIKMCYYKRATLIPVDDEAPEVNKLFLCKQDITALVLQNTVRDTLSTNWRTFVNRSQSVAPHDYSNVDYSNATDINFVKQYKLCTIGYDIGSNKLTGWGEKYEYLDFLWFKAENTYIENMVNLMERMYPLGTLSKFELKDGSGAYRQVNTTLGLDSIIAFDGTTDNISKQIKSIVFEVDYDALYNGTVLHSKNNTNKDDLVTADNCSAALTTLESDGLFQRQKMDRVGNKVYTLTARYDQDNGGANVNRVQSVGTYDEETDTIIYSREYQIFDNVILANYQATHEYVLKNYFTSIWAKYRTYSLMSYGESIRRAENIRKFLVLSKDIAYYEKKNDDDLSFIDNKNAVSFLSFVTPTKIDEKTNKLLHEEKLNCGYFVFYKKDGTNTGYFLSDANTFASGTSLCFNIVTYDNVSGGNYIDALSADLQGIRSSSEAALDYKTTQKWWQMVESNSDAFTENVGFYVCHLDNISYFKDYIFSDDSISHITSIKDRYLSLPKVYDITEFNNNITNKIGVNKIALCKDNKEILDITMQFSFLAYDSENVLFSPWICKLNDFIGFYDKFAKDENILIDLVSGVGFSAYLYDGRVTATVTYWTGTVHTMISNAVAQYVVFKIRSDAFETLAAGDGINKGRLGGLSFSAYDAKADGVMRYECSAKGSGAINFTSLVTVSENRIEVACDYSCSYEYSTGTYLFGFIKINGNSGSSTVLREGTVVLDKVAEATEGEYTYYYFRGSINPDQLKINASAINPCYLSTGKNGSDDATALNSDNSVENVDGQFISGGLETTTTVRKNMFVVVSSEKIHKNLEFNYYRYSLESNPAINTFPSNMLVDENNEITSIFSPYTTSDDKIALSVNCQVYRNTLIGGKHVRSIQYYYRDDKTNIMYFVFGVNLSEISTGVINYNQFNIFLSAVSKRSTDVYDENHNIVGRVANFIDNPNLPYNEQVYEDLQTIPSDYQEVQFLEGDGRQIINTGVYLSNINVIECDCMVYDNKLNQGYLFGSSDSQTHNDFKVECNYDSVLDGTGVKMFVNFNNRNEQSTERIRLNPNEKYSLKFSPTELKINNVIAGTIYFDYLNLQSNSPACLFGISVDDGYAEQKFIGRIYKCKIYDGDTMIRNFVPCIRIEDGKPGMYDTITRQFYTNVGLGEFKFRF